MLLEIAEFGLAPLFGLERDEFFLPALPPRADGGARDIEVREEIDVAGAGDVVSESWVVGLSVHGGRQFAGVMGRRKPGWLDCRIRGRQRLAFGYAAGGCRRSGRVPR